MFKRKRKPPTTVTERIQGKETTVRAGEILDVRLDMNVNPDMPLHDGVMHMRGYAIVPVLIVSIK